MERQRSDASMVATQHRERFRSWQAFGQIPKPDHPITAADSYRQLVTAAPESEGSDSTAMSRQCVGILIGLLRRTFQHRRHKQTHSTGHEPKEAWASEPGLLRIRVP